MIKLLPGLAVLLLAGCATTPSATPVSAPVAKPATTKAAPTRVKPPRGASRLATPQVVPGVKGVIGSDAGALVHQFGVPRLDVVEGDARKLQWSGTACVLDAYLYPPAPGKEPLATYIDARRTSDAQDVDRASCIAALRAARP